MVFYLNISVVDIIVKSFFNLFISIIMQGVMVVITI